MTDTDKLAQEIAAVMGTHPKVVSHRNNLGEPFYRYPTWSELAKAVIESPEVQALIEKANRAEGLRWDAEQNDYSLRDIGWLKQRVEELERRLEDEAKRGDAWREKFNADTDVLAELKTAMKRAAFDIQRGETARACNILEDALLAKEQNE